ncbi:hypothetical protein JANAI62_36880 [Jannaschia pagri]|uniref:Calx-beta domain-containing protein n=1 Tax=Jannaschia pagri TaxID=2829797 RepID=A0ABQ4NS08_9RHOB|nr:MULTISPECIES: Ig-like domain-containing protein [unclassified Jannaschia]GIT93269.1 hypothetical protein JANAI61_37270 [Jannaschia sp. AI_61]GIT97065.1 hypothetical protein JANAI62_36880 [Jannaschia sp. AI_62]
MAEQRNSVGVDGTGKAASTLGDGSEVVLSGATEDFATADAGPNVVAAGGGNDTLRGGDGGDLLDGDAGDDLLDGQGGDDTLIGGAGSDTLVGGAGRDRFAITAGQSGTKVIADYIAGEDQIELAGYGRLGPSDISVDRVDGDLRVTFADGQAVVLAGISSLSGVSLADVLAVDQGRDVDTDGLTPLHLTEADDRYSSNGTTDDRIDAGAGDDVVQAGAGDDTIIGGAGADTMEGGAGADVFRINGADLSGPGATDVIRGFTSGVDKVQFVGLPGVASLGDLAGRLTTVDGNIALDFGGGHRLVFEGITRIGQLSPQDAILGGDAPEIAVALADDTGDSATDGVTTATGITGTVSDDVGLDRLEVRVDGGPWIDITQFLRPDNSFAISEALVARSLGEGSFAAEFRVTDVEGKSVVADLPLTIDATGPGLASGLDVTLDEVVSSLRLRFDEPLSGDTPLPEAFAVTGADGPVTVTSVDRLSPSEVRLNLASALEGGVFAVTGTVADVAGNTSQIGGDVTINAATRVTEIRPADGAQRANLDGKITVAFSAPMDEATLDAGSVQITALGEALAGRYDLSSDGKLLTFFPEDLLPAGTEVRVAFDDSLRDADGAPVQVPPPASFQTVSLTQVPGTNVEGFIFDANYRDEDGLDIPLEGVVVSVIGLPGVTATTDAAGRFLLEDLPIPLAYLQFDASNVTNRPEFDYGTIDKPVETVAGQTIGLRSGDKAFNIYFAALAEADVTELTPGETTEAGIGENGLANLTEIFPGIDPAHWEQLKVIIPADSLTRDDGSLVDQVQVMAFEPDRIPAPLPPGFDPTVVFTVKAEDATNVDGNAQIEFPNIDQLELGAERPILSFDHDAGVWIQTGTAIVVDDGDGGTILRSEGDTGVNTLGWKFAAFLRWLGFSERTTRLLEKALDNTIEGLRESAAAVLNGAAAVVKAIDTIVPAEEVGAGVAETLTVGAAGAVLGIAAGETSKTVRLATSGDNVDEVDGAVVLEAFSVSGGAFAGGAPLVRATSWVLDNDGAANGPALFVSRPVLREGDTGERLAVFELSLSRPAPSGFEVRYATVDGSAEAGSDYEATSGTVRFVAGQQTASVAVVVTGDTAVEASETFTLSVEEVVGDGASPVLDAISLVEATILDDDAGGEAFVFAPQAVLENTLINAPAPIPSQTKDIDSDLQDVLATSGLPDAYMDNFLV